MERLKMMKEMLMCCAENQMGHLEEVDAKELGEVIDMIKDLEEAMYYCTVIEAMKEPKKYGFDSYEKEHDETQSWNGAESYYQEPISYRFIAPTTNGNGNDTSTARDSREGRSPSSRRMYMEARERHQDKASQMRELEKYMQELAQDLVEMVEGASTEEKQYMSKKIAALSNKLGQLND